MLLSRLIRRLLPSTPIETLPSVDAYALWAAHYPPHAHNALMEVEQAAMESLMPPLDGRSVLDLACGSGRYGLLARERGAACVVGVDNSPPMLKANPLPVALSTTEAVPLRSACVDVVLCGMALGHLPALQPSLDEINRVLKPGGVALVSDFHPDLYERGGRRTFTANGVTYAVEHYPRRVPDFRAAAEVAGLSLDETAEPVYAQNPSAGAVVLVMRFTKRDV